MSEHFHPEHEQTELDRITPEELLADNHSDESVFRRGVWQRADDLKQTFIIDTCSDARVGGLFTQLPNHPAVRTLRSIAAASPIRDLRHVIANRESPIIVAPHLKCGGAGAKEALVAGTLKPEYGEMVEYLNHIESAEVMHQALWRASKISELDPRRNVLACVIDHERGLIIPVATISRGGKTVDYAAPVHTYFRQETMYEEGLPRALEDGRVPAEFKPVVEYARQLLVAVAKNPEFPASQQVQNPKAVFATTVLIPEGDRYPNQFSRPNTSFNIVLPYVKNGKRIADIRREVLKDVWQQLFYPIHHFHQARHGHTPHFKDTKTLIIETPDINFSEYVAIKAAKLEWMTEWFGEGGEVFIGEVVSKHEGDRKVPAHTQEMVRLPFLF